MTATYCHIHEPGACYEGCRWAYSADGSTESLLDRLDNIDGVADGGAQILQTGGGCTALTVTFDDGRVLFLTAGEANVADETADGWAFFALFGSHDDLDGWGFTPDNEGLAVTEHLRANADSEVLDEHRIDDEDLLQGVALIGAEPGLELPGVFTVEKAEDFAPDDRPNVTLAADAAERIADYLAMFNGIDEGENTDSTDLTVLEAAIRHQLGATTTT